MALHPSVYAKMLGERIAKHNVQCWLVNTGWTGGPYGVGHRMEIAHTRAMIRAILNGELNEAATFTDPVFGLHIPETVRDVPDEVLNPRNTWKDSQSYDEKAWGLAAQFVENFKQYEDAVDKEILSASPHPDADTASKVQKLRV